MSAVAPPETSPQGTRFMVQWEEHPMHLATRLGYLLEHQSLVDVTLMCNTHTLKVHRSVLAACSPYFESVLKRQLGQHPLIVLKDMKFCVLKSLIEFMYCGETSVTEENLNPLMEAAKFFEVKGLCTMSKEVLAGERPSPNKVLTGTLNGATNSFADIIPATTYRGRGRRSGVGRGRRNLSSMMINASQSQGPPQAETAQIMLSLSGNNASTPTSRSVHISPNTGSTILDTTKLISNGSLSATDLTDLKALREQLNLEPRKRGRRRQNFGLGRGKIKDVGEGKFGIHNIKKEVDDYQHKDGVHFKPLDSKLNLLNNNGNSDAKSPLLASLLSKAEALAKAKVKTENDTEDGQTEQETVLFQFDGESSGASKYLDALKEAGLPTDVPVLIDNGDGNYVTLTEDVLMNVLGNSEEFQFQVTEATLEQGDVSEGVVLQDGTIMMTGKNGKSDLSGPILTVGKKPITIKGVRETKAKRGPKPKLLAGKDVKPKATRTDTSPKKAAKQESTTKKKSVQELINEAMLESLKNGAANEAESDPDAVVLFEVTGNDKVCKYVVSSKEVNALKALNEQIEKQKRLDSPTKKESILPTVIDGNTNIAEIKLTMSTNSRKSIVSEVLARAHSLENQVKAASMLNDLPKSTIKQEDSSSQMLNINMETDVLNDSSQFIGLNPEDSNLENSNMMELVDEPQMLDDSSSMAVINDQSQLIRMKEQEDVNVSENENLIVGDHENLIVVNDGSDMLQQGDLDLAEEPSESSQLMHMNESSQDGVGEDTEDATEDISGEDTDGTIPHGGRDMPLLESESQLVELEFIDGDGQKIEGYQVEGTVLSRKEISELAGLDNENKDSEVIGLLDMVCEEAASQDDLSNEVLNDVSTLKQIAPSCSSAKACVQSAVESISQSEFRVNGVATETEHLVMQEVQNIERRHLPEDEMLDEDEECQDLSVEQALQAMMGDGSNTIVESEEFNQEINPPNQDQRCSSLNRLENSESINCLDNPNNFEFVYEASENTPTERAQVVSAEPEMNILPDDSTNKIMAELKPLNPDDAIEESMQSTIISPTKDVPFAVGLLPLKDALEQYQSIQEHQPRKTRSGSTSRPEVNGTKRRSSSEQPADGSVKRRKSADSEESSNTNQILEVNAVNPSA